MKLTPMRDKRSLTDYHRGLLQQTRSTVKANHHELSTRVQEALKELNIDSSRVLITGSDARGENSIFLRKKSPGDLIVTMDTSHLGDHLTLEQISSHLTERGLKIEELKRTNDVRMFFQGREDVVFPTRIFDAVLVDNFEASPSERKILFEEIKKYAKNTIKRFRSKVGDAKNAMISGQSKIKGEVKKEIDFEKSVIHYDPANFINGVKTGSLRFVQYGLMRCIINRVRGGTSSEIDITLPSNIIDRIDAMKGSGILPISTQEAEDLKYAYGYLLYLHHMMQSSSINSNSEENMFEIDTGDMKDIQEMFKNLEAILTKIGGNEQAD